MSTREALITEPMGRPVPLFRNLPSGRVQCTACARYCQIGEGHVGLCGIRGVVNGKLYLFVYGKVITGHIDPIEKKPVVHYRPGSKIFSIATTGCNWLCHPAGTRILTAEGDQKMVEELLPGETVWSYDLENGMTIHPNAITHVGTRTAELWDVRYGSRGLGRLLLTEEHPVFTATGWKTVKELAKGESILKVWYQNTRTWKQNRAISIKRAEFNCDNCGAVIQGLKDWNRHRGECYTQDLEIEPEVRARYSHRMKTDNPMRNPEVAKRALQSSKERFLHDPTHGWHKNIERLRAWLHRHPSASQTRLYQILDELGVPYETEFKIYLEKRTLGSKTYYIADAAFPEPRLDIEIDGWWHYHNPGVMQSDRIRDEALKSNGWDVLRISGSYLFNHPEEVKALIAQRLARPVMVNKRQWVVVHSVRPTDRIEKVYSLETIPNHNYVAEGIVVHNCSYCQNYDISQRRKVEGLDVEAGDVVRMALERRCQGIAYTYNEPTIFIEWAHDIGVIARERGLFNIFVTNGFETPDAVGLIKDFLDCATVDFKGSGETNFVRRYIGIPSAEPIFQTLLELRDRTRVHVEITDLIVPEVGDDLEAARKLSKWVYDNLGPDTPVHFLRFHPDYKLMHLPYTPIETLEAHYKVAKAAGLRYVYLGNVPGHPWENTYCPGCGTVVLEKYGYDITGWHLDEHNRCMKCGCPIPIVGKLEATYREHRFVPVLS